MFFNSYPQDHYWNSYDSSYSYTSPILCDYCESSNHDADSCPYRNYIGATCASLGKKINKLTDKMTETMKEKTAEYS